MIYVGIDPGATGAIAWSSAAMGECGEILDTKDGRQLAFWLKEIKVWDGQHVAAIEKVHSMPRQGVASAFKFGMSYGAAVAVCQALEFPFRLVTPQAWYKVALDQRPKPKAGKNEKKAAVLAAAQDRWPKACLRKADGAIAEALWMAEWLRREIR